MAENEKDLINQIKQSLDNANESHTEWLNSAQTLEQYTDVAVNHATTHLSIIGALVETIQLYQEKGKPLPQEKVAKLKEFFPDAKKTRDQLLPVLNRLQKYAEENELSPNHSELLARFTFIMTKLDQAVTAGEKFTS